MFDVWRGAVMMVLRVVVLMAVVGVGMILMTLSLRCSMCLIEYDLRWLRGLCRLGALTSGLLVCCHSGIVCWSRWRPVTASSQRSADLLYQSRPLQATLRIKAETGFGEGDRHVLST